MKCRMKKNAVTLYEQCVHFLDIEEMASNDRQIFQHKKMQ